MDKNIYVFGSSIAQGHNDLERGGWVQRLTLYCWKNFDDILVYNLGASGNTTKDILERFESELNVRSRRKTNNVVIFAIGMNDSAFLKKQNKNFVQFEKFKRNLIILDKIARKHASKTVFLGLSAVNEEETAPIPWRKSFYYLNDHIKKYDLAIEEFCYKNDIYCVKIFDLLKKDDLDDGLHPNARGHEKIFKRVKNYLIENKII